MRFSLWIAIVVSALLAFDRKRMRVTACLYTVTSWAMVMTVSTVPSAASSGITVD